MESGRQKWAQVGVFSWRIYTLPARNAAVKDVIKYNIIQVSGSATHYGGWRVEAPATPAQTEGGSTEALAASKRPRQGRWYVNREPGRSPGARLASELAATNFTLQVSGRIPGTAPLAPDTASGCVS